MNWYYIDESVTDGDRRKGPFTEEEMREFAKNGEIQSETLVWFTGEKNWATWKEVEAKVTNEKEEEIKKILEGLIEAHNVKSYVGFFPRALAFFIDNLILSVAGALLFLAFNVFGVVDLSSITDLMNVYINDPSSETALTDVMNAKGMRIYFAIWGIVQAFYFIIFTTLKGATPGKKILRFHVENVNGETLSWMQSTIRYVASLISQITLMFYGVAYLIVFFDPKRRTLHDFIGRTRVVFNDKNLKSKQSQK